MDVIMTIRKFNEAGIARQPYVRSVEEPCFKCKEPIFVSVTMRENQPDMPAVCQFCGLEMAKEAADED